MPPKFPFAAANESAATCKETMRRSNVDVLITKRARGGAGWHAAIDEAGDRAWLADFARHNGRKLRVLHVGNIANNAFLNAKFLRQAGIEADVLCYDYYHVMGMPEWEELDLRHPYGDDYQPCFDPADLEGYERPAWFMQGPLTELHRAITADPPPYPSCGRSVATQSWDLPARVDWRRSGFQLIDAAMKHERLRTIWRTLRLRYVFRPAIIRLLTMFAVEEVNPHVAEFDATFPTRADRLSSEDIVPFLAYASLMRDIFERYDIVQLYSTDPMYGWLAGNRPYVGFEHGTLRDFTLGDKPVHRLTSMGYRRAEHVFITNGDCLEYANKIGLKRYSPMIHPIDVQQHRSEPANMVAAVRAEHPADILLLCPLRHSWGAKGTDIHLRALPLICQRVKGRVRLVLTEWGEEIQRSRELIAELGCTDAVEWINPLPRSAMIRLTRASDVVLDQMALPHFGATAPQAMAAGVPVISSYVPESTRWIIEEPAPILPAFSPEQVCDRVMTALDPGWRHQYQVTAGRWIDTYHHPRRVVADHLHIYRNIVGRANEHRKRAS
jgi:glycosyltransferase involved in cell wall biosynthesis